MPTWPADDLGRVIAAMQERMMTAPWQVLGRWVGGGEGAGVGLGSVALKATAERHPRLAVDPGGQQVLVLDGELLETSRLAAELAAGGESPRADDHAGLLLEGCQREGAAFLRRVHGSFSAAWWDGSRGRLTLMTDRFGTRPVYYQVPQAQAGGLRFASGLAAVVEPAQRVAIHPRGLAQFFTFGHYLRDDTSIAGIAVLPAAAWCVLDVKRASWTRSTYWSLKEAASSAPARREELLEGIEAALAAAVDRCTQAAEGLGLSLSGGLDARTILGLVDTGRTPLTAVCLGMPGSLDHRASRQLAQLAGCPLHLCMLDADFLSRFGQHMQQMVALTDGQYLSQCIVMPTLPVYRELGIRSLLRGHAGELMHLTKAYNYSLDEAGLAIATDAQLRSWLLARLQAYLLDGVARPLFRGDLDGAMAGLAAESLDEDLAEVAELGPPRERIGLLFLMQRVRRETTLSLLKFRSVVEPRLPYLDAELVGRVLAAPLTMRLDEEVQTWILRRRRPAFLRVVNSNTGAPLGAGRWRRKLASVWMRGMAKLGVPGYQPYERLGLWLRRELAPLVRQVLLDVQTLDRGVYDPDGVRAVVRGHLEQGRNHTFLLLALMIFELGLRRLQQVAARPDATSLSVHAGAPPAAQAASIPFPAGAPPQAAPRDLA